ncbi:MAG TPA: ABC transporter substrate-binding protein [Polyangia bacterium]
MRMLAVVSLLVLPSLASAAGTLGPMATLKQKNGDVDKLLRQRVDKGTPAEDKQKDEIKRLAGTLLDYDELAQKSLSAHWEKLTSPQRNEFVSTLRELIERNYVKQLRTNLDYQVQYRGEENGGDQATVTTIVKVKSAGKKTDAEIIYKMKKAGDGWRVWDVITDEISLVKNYRTQFNKIITEQSYDALIKKMKSKLKDGE